MGMTITEKILARHAGTASVAPGENVWVDVDVLMSNDVIAPQMIGVFEENFGPDAPVWDAGKVVMIPDHYIFTADPKAHRNVAIMREFVAAKGVRHHYDADFVPAGLEGMPQPYDDPTTTAYSGVCHVTLPQKGHTRPGELLLGTDSHTCTHGAFGEFASGIGSTDGAFVLGTGRLWLKVPPSLKFVFRGRSHSSMDQPDTRCRRPRAEPKSIVWVSPRGMAQENSLIRSWETFSGSSRLQAVARISKPGTRARRRREPNMDLGRVFAAEPPRSRTRRTSRLETA